MRLFDVSDRKPTTEPTPAVRINGIEISRAEIAREIQNHPANTPGAARASMRPRHWLSANCYCRKPTAWA